MKIWIILWQLPQYLLSLVIWGYYKAIGKIEQKVCVTGGVAGRSCVYFLKSNRRMAFSMGKIIFLYNGFPETAQGRRTEMIRHEYGHAIQSVYLGWLYLIVIGLPSLIITGISPALAEKCYFEKWANSLVKDRELTFTD